MIFAGTALFMVPFLYEPARASLSDTPFSHDGTYLIAVGTLAHVIAGTV